VIDGWGHSFDTFMTRTPVFEWGEDLGRLMAVCFSPDGALPASRGQDGAVWLWGLTGRAGTRTLLSRPGWLPALQVVLALTAVALLVAALRIRGRGTTLVAGDAPDPRILGEYSRGLIGAEPIPALLAAHAHVRPPSSPSG
jgi:hypothetical protein